MLATVWAIANDGAIALMETVQRSLGANATVIGGCGGTRPATIARLREMPHA